MESTSDRDSTRLQWDNFKGEPDWLPASRDEVVERKAIPCQRPEQRVTSSVTLLLTVSSPRGWCSTVGCDRHFVIRVPIVIGKTAADLETIGFVHVLERLQHWNHERVRQPRQETHLKPMPPLFLCWRFGSSAGQFLTSVVSARKRVQ